LKQVACMRLRVYFLLCATGTQLTLLIVISDFVGISYIAAFYWFSLNDREKGNGVCVELQQDPGIRRRAEGCWQQHEVVGNLWTRGQSAHTLNSSRELFIKKIKLGAINARGSVIEWLGCWTCDYQVTRTNPGCCAVECNPGQVVHTHVTLSPSSIKLVPA